MVDNENIKSNKNRVANTFNDLFSNIVKNLKILEYQCENDLHSISSSHPALQAIMKYMNHPSINIIRHFSQSILVFIFHKLKKNTVLKEIRRLSSKKAVQETDIPVKILKENADFFAEHICRQLNEAICSSKFPATFKFANVTPVCFQKRQPKSKR